MKSLLNRRSKNKVEGVSKGAPSGVVISLIIHAAAFLLAGALVVFEVFEQKEAEFVPPPPVQRPKMQIKKPKPTVRSSSKPRPSKIMTKSTMATPAIQLPDVGGMSIEIDKDFGSIDFSPDLEQLSVLGQPKSIGNDFEGYLYSLQRRRNGSWATEMTPEGFLQVLYRFCKDGWKESDLSKAWRSSTKLYTTHFMVPPIISEKFPDAFGAEDLPAHWIFVKYKGNLVYKEDIRFRFWGAADAYLLVRVDGRVVLVALNDNNQVNQTFDPWKPARYSSTKSGAYRLGTQSLISGEWIELKAGVPLQMELFFGEYQGGASMAGLLVEVDGVEYPKNRQNGPLLPAFKTEEFTLDQLDAIRALLPEDECSLTNGPVFRDF